MYNYCTLFDKNYLTRGLAMYESLQKHAGSFHLYIFAFDDVSCEVLKELTLDNVTVVSLHEFEDEQLLAVKPSRTAGEYCWTCTPSIIKYCLDNYDIVSCTYLDADLYFFGNPAVLIDEAGDKSVLITEHRYTPEYDQTATSGVYCVQFMYFKGDTDGMRVLDWWREACLDWCYARHEDGKFGDQKYLDDWTTRFSGVHVLQHMGGGVAPWNVQQYTLNETFPLIFYHFHQFQFLENGKVDFGNYKLTKQDIDKLYIPYLKHLLKISESLKRLYQGDFNGILKLNTKDKIVNGLKKIVKRVNNVYRIDALVK